MKKGLYLGLVGLVSSLANNAPAVTALEGECIHVEEQIQEAKRKLFPRAEELSKIIEKAEGCDDIDISPLLGKDIRCYKKTEICAIRGPVPPELMQYCYEYFPRGGCPHQPCAVYHKNLVHQYSLDAIESAFDNIVQEGKVLYVRLKKEEKTNEEKDKEIRKEIKYTFPDEETAKKALTAFKDFLESYAWTK